MTEILGRSEEIKILQSLYDTSAPQLVAVYGRRRIGKTFLVSHFFPERLRQTKGKGHYFELTGIKDAELKTQLNNFAREYADVFNFGESIPAPASWFEAFDLLRKRVQEKKPEEKVIIFLDELPWLASPRSQFLPALDHTWNRHLSREQNVIVIVCGSAASWMIKRVLYHKGGLHGRLTCTLKLLPFTLAETRQFLQAQRINLTPQQLIELYMATGGVAKYLTNMKAGQSANQLIQGRYFDEYAPLKGEFHRLLSSLFSNHQRHVDVIRALSKHHYGLTNDQLLAATGMHSGGGFTTLITELMESGFVTYLPQFGHKKKNGKYLLTDEFALFYLKWVEGWEHEIADLSGYWQRQSNTPAYRTWAGYAFETLCIKNIVHIKQQLGIAGVTTRVSQWHDQHAQIDLVIDRADHCINLCEIKFSQSEYSMTKKDAMDLSRKKERFLQGTQTKKAVFVTLITVNGVTSNQHTIDSVDSHVRGDEFIV